LAENDKAMMQRHREHRKSTETALVLCCVEVRSKTIRKCL
jgi:hypothetical protein